MSCETCSIRDFVHADLYCSDCPDRPKPEIKTGRAYLFQKNMSRPITSVDIRAPEGQEYAVAVVELMKEFKIEFVENDPKTRGLIKKLKNLNKKLDTV